MKTDTLILLCLATFQFFSLAESSTSRIIGGTTAFTSQFPFAAAVSVTTTDSRFFCAGTLLTQQWIVTAAQCVDGAVLFTIQLGSNTLNSEDSNRVTVATSDYVLHPDYNPDTLENDIGLIKLRMPVEFSNYLKASGLLPTDPLEEGTTLVAIGWGQISDEDSELVDHLRWVILSSLSNTECKLTYGNQIKDNMVCAEGNYNEGACIGDTGGPLIQILNNGQTIINGISSFVSANGCESLDPSGYTRIYPYKEWILNITSSSQN